MAPYPDHAGGIVAAHTLSREAVLRKVSKDGHVYALNCMGPFTLDDLQPPMRRLGLRDVSVFNGFCAKHDAAMFSCLENEPFCFSRKQLFLLVYRAAARECYGKRKQYESLPKPEQIGAIHGNIGPFAYTDEILKYQAESLRGGEEKEAFKAKLDAYLVIENWDRFITHAVLFPKRPSIAACFVFQPFNDMNGHQLQDYDNLEAEMSDLAMSILPLEQGGAVVFSWLNSGNSAPRRFYESVIDTGNLTSSVLHVALDNSENLALSPMWYESLPQPTRDYLSSRIALPECGITYLQSPRPELSAPLLDDWGPGNVAEF